MLNGRIIRNRQLLVMGIRPVASYHTRPLPGAYVHVEWVDQESETQGRYLGTVRTVDDRLDWVDVVVVPDVDEPGTPTRFRLFRSGPTEDGVVAFRILRPGERRPTVPPSRRQTAVPVSPNQGRR